MGWVCLLLLILIYICAIAVTTMIGHNENYAGYNNDEEGIVSAWNNYQYFGTITRSMYTLFCVVLLAEYPEIGRAVVEEQPAMILFFMIFIVITSFGIMNVIIGVIVDNTMEAAKSLERDQAANENLRRLNVADQIHRSLFNLVKDGGELSMKEVELGLSNPDIRAMMQEAQVPKSFQAEDLMLLLDVDGTGKVSAEEFMGGFHTLLFSDDFQKQCINTVDIHRVQRGLYELTELLKEVGIAVGVGNQQVHNLGVVKQPVTPAIPLGNNDGIFKEFKEGEEMAFSNMEIMTELKKISHQIASFDKRLMLMENRSLPNVSKV
jgi:voltage-gated sodium channel